MLKLDKFLRVEKFRKKGIREKDEGVEGDNQQLDCVVVQLDNPNLDNLRTKGLFYVAGTPTSADGGFLSRVKSFIEVNPVLFVGKTGAGTTYQVFHSGTNGYILREYSGGAWGTYTTASPAMLSDIPTDLSAFTDTTNRIITDVSGLSDNLGKFDAKEDKVNKKYGLETNSDEHYPSVKAVKSYVDNLVVGGVKYVGSCDLSGGEFPIVGGSGEDGAITSGDMFIVEVEGTIDDKLIRVGDSLIAQEDNPGQDIGKWNILGTSIFYVPENVENKKTTLETNSDEHYPSVKAINTAISKLVNSDVDGEPEGFQNIKNIGAISENDYNVALSQGGLVATTLYFVFEN